MSDLKRSISSSQLSIADDQTEDQQQQEESSRPLANPLGRRVLRINRLSEPIDQIKPRPEEMSPYEQARQKFQQRMHSPPVKQPKEEANTDPPIKKWKSMKIGQMIEQRRPAIEKRNQAIQQDLISIFNSQQEQKTPVSPNTKRTDMMMDPVIHRGGFDTHHPLMYHETGLIQRRKRKPNREDSMSDEFDSPVGESEEQSHRWEKIAIPHTSSFYQFWKPIMIIFNFVSSVQYLYYGTFLHTVSRQQQDHFDALNHFYMFVFAVDTFIHLFLTEALSPYPFKKILGQRLQFQLPFDLLSFMPFNEILGAWLTDTQSQKLYLLKTLRLYHGLILLDSRSFKRQVKDILQRRLKRLTQRFRKRKTIKGFTKISLIVLLSHVLKTAQLVVFLVSLSYFTGLLWHNYCTSLVHIFQEEDNFMEQFGIQTDSNFNAVVKMTYFAFTTLSTVGLGDFYPVSDGERVLGSFIMLFGVLITTLLMNNLNSMLVELKEFNKSHDESDKLAQFFGTLTWFNEGDPVSPLFTSEVEQYFRYRWQADRNLAVSSREDLLILSELPLQVKTNLYMDYLFKGFLDMYRQLFFVTSIRTDFKRQILVKEFSLTSNPTFRLESLNFYSNDQYRDILVQVLSCLEPIRFLEGRPLLKKKEAVGQVYFPMTGQVEIGYNHNAYLIQLIGDQISDNPLFRHLKNKMKENKKKFCFPISSYPGLAIGFFEVLFNLPAQFHYRVKVSEQSQATGGLKPTDFLFLRAINLGKRKELLDSQDFSLIQELKINVLANFCEKIFFPIQDHKLSEMKSEEKVQEDRVKASVISIFNKPRDQRGAGQDTVMEKPQEVAQADEAAILIRDGKLKREHGVTKRQLLSKMPIGGRQKREFQEITWLQEAVDAALTKAETQMGEVHDNYELAREKMVDYINQIEEAKASQITLLEAQVAALKSDTLELSQKVYDLKMAKQDAEHRLQLAEAKFKSKIEKVKKKSSKKVEIERNHHMQSSLMLARNFALQIKRVQSNVDIAKFHRQQLSPTSRRVSSRESNNLSTSKATRIEIQKVDSPEVPYKNIRFGQGKESFQQKFNRRFSRGPGPSSHHDSARVLMGASKASGYFFHLKEQNQQFGSQNGEPDDQSIDMPSEYISRRLFSVHSKKKETDLVKEELDDYQDQLKGGSNSQSSSVSNHSSVSKNNFLDPNQAKTTSSKSSKSLRQKSPPPSAPETRPKEVPAAQEDKIEDESLFLKTCKEANDSSSSSSIQADSKGTTEQYSDAKKSSQNIFIEYSTSPDKNPVFRSTAFQARKKSLLSTRQEANDSSKDSHREEEKDQVPLYGERKIESKRTRLPYQGRMLHHGVSQEVIPTDHLSKPAPHASGRLSYFNLRSSQGVGQNTDAAGNSVSSQEISIRQSHGRFDHGEEVCLETSSKAPSLSIKEEISIRNSRMFSQASIAPHDLEMSAVKEKTESSAEEPIEELLCEDTGHQGSSNDSKGKRSRWGKHSQIESGSMCNFIGVNSSITGSALQGIGSSSIAGSNFQRSSFMGASNNTAGMSAFANQGQTTTSFIGSHGPGLSTFGNTTSGVGASSMVNSAMQGTGSTSVKASAFKDGTGSGSPIGSGSKTSHHQTSMGSTT